MVHHKQIISASEINANLTDDKAEQIASILSAKADQYKRSQRTTQAPFQKQFVSASGDTMTGYLVEAKKIVERYTIFGGSFN